MRRTASAFAQLFPPKFVQRLTRGDCFHSDQLTGEKNKSVPKGMNIVTYLKCNTHNEVHGA